MIKLMFRQEDGSSKTIASDPHLTLMEAARANDIDNLLAECGGGLACGTCHVIVDGGWSDRLPRPNDMELEMIGGLESKTPASRLSCQIALSKELDGLSVLVPRHSSI